MNADTIARVAHAVNRAYREALDEDPGPTWEEAGAEARAGVVTGVRRLLENPKLDGRALHESWAEDKLAAGWTYSVILDRERKTHPQLIPYDELPVSQRIKDALFKATVLAMREP